MNKHKNYPFYDWVPKPLGILILILLFFPIMTVGGVYSVNSSLMTGELGITAEYIQFANMATSIGMAALGPLMYSIITLRREKLMCLFGFSIMFVLSYICSQTDSLFLLALCCIIMGAIRFVLVLCNLFTLFKYLSGIDPAVKMAPGAEPKDEAGWDKMDIAKSMSQSVIYLFCMILGQLGNTLVAWMAHEYQWQYSYYFLMGILFVAILLVMITMPFHDYRGLPRMPINFKKFGNYTLYAIVLSCVTYILLFGKTLDWFDNENICNAAKVGVVALLFVLIIDSQRDNKYMRWGVLRSRPVRRGLVLYILMMSLNTCIMLVSIYSGIAMKIDHWQSASLNCWGIVGYVLAAVVIIKLRKRNVHFKYFYALGFLFIGLAALFMYFEVQTQGLYSRLKWPVMLCGFGMFLIYVLATTYSFQRLENKYIPSAICLILTCRAVLGPSMGVALYTNVFQERQQYYITRYAHDVDDSNLSAVSDYKRTALGMYMQGKTETEGRQMATMQAKGKVTVQATLSAIKEIAGWTVWACLGIAILILIVRWPKKKIVPLPIEENKT